MEDRHICLPLFDIIFDINKESLPNNNCNYNLFAIFDGHGGDLAATYCGLEFAFKLKENLVKQGNKDKSLEEIMKESLIQLNLDFLKASTSDSGSTAVVVLHEFSENEEINCLHSIWVGDSEAFVCRENFVSNPDDQITENLEKLTNKKKSKSKEKNIPLVLPHKLTDPEEIARIMKAGGRVEPPKHETDVPRVNGKLAIARAIGDRDDRDAGVDCLPDYKMVDLTKFIFSVAEKGAAGDFSNSQVKNSIKSSSATSISTISSIKSNNSSNISSAYPNTSSFQPTYLVIACDGLWDVLNASDCYEELQNHTKEVLEKMKKEKNSENQQGLKAIQETDSFNFKAARLLTKVAFQKFSTDNISVICVNLDGNFDKIIQKELVLEDLLKNRNLERTDRNKENNNLDNNNNNSHNSVNPNNKLKNLSSFSTSTKIQPLNADTLLNDSRNSQALSDISNNSNNNLIIEGELTELHKKDTFISADVAMIVKNHGERK